MLIAYTPTSCLTDIVTLSTPPLIRSDRFSMISTYTGTTTPHRFSRSGSSLILPVIQYHFPTWKPANTGHSLRAASPFILLLAHENPSSRPRDHISHSILTIIIHPIFAPLTSSHPKENTAMPLLYINPYSSNPAQSHPPLILPTSRESGVRRCRPPLLHHLFPTNYTIRSRNFSASSSSSMTCESVDIPLFPNFLISSPCSCYLSHLKDEIAKLS